FSVSIHMIFYHLSRDELLEYICPSSAEQTSTTITPRVPDDCPGEDQVTRRVCVAPSVWQCLLSKPRPRPVTLHIYEINVEWFTDPITDPSHPINDFDFTGEKWVTDKDVDLCGGKIEMTYGGYIEATDELEWKLRELEKQKKL